MYSAKQLDRTVVNPDQIGTVIRTFRDSHAGDIIQIVREGFGEGNQFFKMVTYNASEDPKSVLAQTRNDFYPRIAVTVDMIATGTDVKPLECPLFMRDFKSRNYFEQMKGRCTRTLDADSLKKVTPSAVTAKTDYVIVSMPRDRPKLSPLSVWRACFHPNDYKRNNPFIELTALVPLVRRVCSIDSILG